MISRDFAFALRTLRKHPAFTTTAIVTIGLGIGASTAIFSVVNAVLLRPLPYPDPERLFVLEQLPRTAINKVKKDELRSMVEGTT